MNRPVHFEIHATDPEAMAKFYSAVFGWNVRHMPEFNYWLFEAGAGDVAATRAPHRVPHGARRAMAGTTLTMCSSSAPPN
jgi:predicted enzyme related to lactoylglutathione lyase